MKTFAVPFSFLIPFLLLTGLSSQTAFAACGGTVRTWTGTTNAQWGTNVNNWSPANVPNTVTEDAIIVASTNVSRKTTSHSIGCVEVQSGIFRANTNGINLTINGDYFKAPNSGTVDVTAGTTFTLIMAGTATQTIETQDPLNYVTISNNTTVNFTKAFTIRNTLSITGTGTTLNINDNLTLENAAAAFQIPSGRTVEVAAGKTLTALGGVTVNGTLKLNPGSSLVIGNGTTLQVVSGGLLQLAGASGNIASIQGNGGAFTFTVDGSINANYFRIDRLTAAGINVTGTIQQFSNGELHYLASSGVGLTLGATSNIPSNMNSIGFFDDSAFGNVKNIDATNYNNSSTTLNDWSGLGGESNEFADPNSKINWGSQAGTKLTLSNNTASGSPPATINRNTGPLLFATFSFALNQADLYTDITQVILTQYGTATSSDVNYIQVFKDTAGGTSCVYDAGVDTQIGSNLTLSGSPPIATVNLSSGDVRTNSTAPACFHVLVRTSASAQDGNTIGFRIAETGDVTNVKSDLTSYSFSDTSGPPVSAGFSTITANVSSWDGSSSTAWNTAANWTPATLPSSTRDCIIQSGVRVPALGANRQCMNATMPTGGSLDFGSAAYELQAFGSLTVQSSYTFVNAASGTLRMQGAINQSMSIATAFPGNLFIANTGSATINVDSDSTINGNITISQGILKINDGATLTTLGNITVQTGTTLEIAAGGILAMADGKTLTVNSGGTLKMVGTSSKTAMITLSTGTSGYSVVINGTVNANYYTINKMGLNGFTINAGATIDNTNHLQNGNFTYPMVNNTVMLKLNRQVPTNSMDGTSFDAAGSTATGVTNILTNAAAGTLTINGYSGSWSGPSYDNDPTYLISWTGATNTLDLTQDATGPANVSQGATYTMGRFGFKQTQAGASFSNTNITSIKLTLTGTGTASDVNQARIYYDSDCDNTAGTLIGTGTFSGNPATVIFSSLTGAVVEADVSTPPKRCIYVQYDIDGNAVNANTVGVKINASGDVVNSQSYAISGGTPPPVTLGNPANIIGTSTTWTGTTGTAWCTPGNWNGGLPTASLNCVINDVANDPIISTTCGGNQPVCKNVTINSGSLTMQAGTELQVYGGFTNSATFTQNTGVLRLMDDGTNASNQVISTASNSFGTVTFTKTAGGTAQANGSTVTIGTLTIPAGSNFEWQVPNAQTLTLTNGVTIPAGTFTVEQGGTLALPNSQGVAVNGGTFKTTGVNDAYPQSTSNKAKITISGAGRWFFTSSSGTVNLTGFLLDYIDTNGLIIGGNTTLANLNGGQFTNLSTSYSSVKAIQLNTTGSIPATASNFGWNWGAANSTYNNPPSPLVTDGYLLASSTGCNNQTISFDQWFGDFFVGLNQPNTATKISTSNCNISIAASASPVTLVSLSATPYNAAVIVNWQTGAEIDHQGFNVFRSTNPSSGFIQVNPQLIRNFSSSGAAQGKYRYLDQDVLNGTTYYYRVEDIAINGTRTLHGPVNATPDVLLDPPPGVSDGTNGGNSTGGANNGNTPSNGQINTPEVIDLGNGIHILAQTQNSLRIEIIPPPATLSASNWNGAYKTILLPGYSNTLDAGRPELVERVIMIEVDESHTTAKLTNGTVYEAAVENHNIAPAPSWILNGNGTLVPQWSIDADAYAINNYSPSSFYEVNTQLVSVSGKKFVKIKAMPFRYNPVSTALRRATKIILDIGLDGNAWDTPTHNKDLELSPSAVEGVLRIRYNQTGMYELTYDDIANAGFEGFFAGKPIVDFRLYLGFAGTSTEAAIETLTSSANFSPGDMLRFYLSYTPTLEDTQNEAVLSTFALTSNSGNPLRMQHLNGDNSGLPDSDEVGSFARATAEKDLIFIQDTAFASLEDHFYWKRIYAEAGGSANAASTYFSIPVDLPYLISDATQPIRVKLYLRGRAAQSENPTHHVSIYVNAVPFAAGDTVFKQQGPTMLNFEIPASLFAPGINNLKVKVLADRLAVGDYDIIDIDKLVVEYQTERVAIGNTAEIFNYKPNHGLTVTGFNSASISVYDTTVPEDVHILDNVQVTSNGGLFDVKFGANDGDSDLSYRYSILKNSAFLKPAALILGTGYPQSLISTTNGADLIVIGTEELIDAADELIQKRKSQGLRVFTASLGQIYAEFSSGVKSSQAIRDFILYSISNWVAPAPKYLLILGDATYDSRDRFGYGVTDSITPIPIEKGTYGDYGNDNWFVANETTSLPIMAAGRIPARTAASVTAYVNKLLDYESEGKSPTESNSRQIAFVSDSDTKSEGFYTQSTGLAETILSMQPNYTTRPIDRTLLGSDAATKTAILNAFDNAPLIINYFGHGAENLWAGYNVFTNDDATALANNRLPFVLSLTCVNGYFYDPDPSMDSMGEKLILQASGGAVGFLGSTAFTNPNAQLAFAKAFFNALTQETKLTAHTVRFGDLMLNAKLAVGTSDAKIDVVKSYTLLGDPTALIPETSFTGTTPTAEVPPKNTTDDKDKDGNSDSSTGNTPSSSGGGKKGGGGLLGCGMIYDHGNDNDINNSGNGAFEFTALALVLILTRLFLRRFYCISNDRNRLCYHDLQYEYGQSG